MLKTKYILQFRMPHGIAGRVLLALMDLWHRPFASWVISAIGEVESLSFIDIGCGSGLYIRKLINAGCRRADGIDISGESVRKAMKRTRRFRKECTVFAGSCESIPSDSAFYDAALAADTVIYWEDIVKSFREVCRVLRSGGSFYIASELSDKGDAPEWILKSGYIHVRTPSELADMLEKAGFRSVEVLRANGPWMIIKAIKG